MIITTTTETKYRVEMTAQQRQALILALIALMENDAQASKHFQAVELNAEQKEVIDDLRLSLLNAA